jgi:translation initiation factor 2B subunit (eIF-2B alpha/beta/delta family)
MGSLWNAAAAALAVDDRALDRFAVEAVRAPEAIARSAEPLLELRSGRSASVLTLATWSASGPVREVISRMARRMAVTVRCAEARPALEGRRLAGALARAGARVEVFADGALAAAVADADAVLVGADAIGEGWFVNKAGTRAVALVASAAGVPTYVLAGRDKCLGAALWCHVRLREGPPAEIWRHASRGIAVRNPYFERVPWDGVAALVTDRGVLGADDVAAICRAAAGAYGQDALARVLRARPLAEPRGGNGAGSA